MNISVRKSFGKRAPAFMLAAALSLLLPHLSAIRGAIAHAGPGLKPDPANKVFVAAGGDFQKALNQASPGDTILLEAGAAFTGNFILPKTTTTSGDWVTIRSSAADSELPPPGTRVDPSFAPAMPRVVSPNSVAAVTAAPGAHHYRFIGVEFTFADDAAFSSNLIRLGEGRETDPAALPHDILIDRCYIHGGPTRTLRRGVALNSARTDIINSYISDCHEVGADSQAICGWNGPGPFNIINNYLEASGENVLFGGADAKIQGLIPSDIVVRGNHFKKPASWKEGIVAKPAAPVAAQEVRAEGKLAPNVTYYYRVTGHCRVGFDTTAMSAASDEAGVTADAGTNSISLAWEPVIYARSYRVYRTTDPPTSTSRSWLYYTSQSASFTDVGNTSSSTAGSPPPVVATRWTVKNLLELKNAQRVLIEGNLFENNWVDGQTGYAILFKSQNQDGGAPWSVTRDVEFRNNIVRHTSSAINILGRDPYQPSGQMARVSITNNLFEDVGTAEWGGEGTFLKITDIEDVSVDHNTIIHRGNIITAYGPPSTRFAFSNNIVAHNAYGVKGDGSDSGNDTLGKYFPDNLFKKNVVAGAKSEKYPKKKNYYPASIDEVGFIDRAGGNYRLASSSPYKKAGTKQKDIGADLDAIEEAVSGQHQ